MPLLACAGTFSEQLHFRRTYFLTVSTSSDQLVVQSNQLDATVTSAAQLFLQNCFELFWSGKFFQICDFFSAVIFFRNSNFFRAKLLPSIYFLRIDRSLGQLLFRRTNLFRINIEELLFRSRYFCTVSNFAEQLLFQQS